MIYGSDRDAMRRVFVDAWRKAGSTASDAVVGRLIAKLKALGLYE